MLDLFVFKHEHHSCVQLAYKPYVKPTARHVVLSSTSAHSRSCHRSWPCAEIQRMHSRAAFSRDFEAAKQAKLERFRWFFLDPGIVSKACAWQPKGVCVQIPGITKPPTRPVVRLILPWSCRWRGFVREFMQLTNEWKGHLDAIGWSFDFSISFASSGKPLKQMVNFRVEPSLHVFRKVAAINGRRMGTEVVPLVSRAPGSIS
jgi:hypothetical protein